MRFCGRRRGRPGRIEARPSGAAARERNVGWRIDYFVISDRLREKVKDAYILPEVQGSDHCPVGLDVTW